MIPPKSQCPNCHTRNSQTALRCTACGTSLHQQPDNADAVSYRRAAFWVDARIFSGIGAVVGLGLGWLLRYALMSEMRIYLDQRERYLLIAASVIVGAVCGVCLAAKRAGADAVRKPLKPPKRHAPPPPLSNPWERDH